MSTLSRSFAISFYSFDSLGNPWVSGGGALRDFEILRRYAECAPVRLITGRYPDFQSGMRDGVEVRGLGFGKSNWLCRLTYTVAANLRILFDRAEHIGLSPSIYAPVLASLLRRRVYFVMHHYVGSQSFRKYGLFGITPFLCEQLFIRFGHTYFVLNRSLRDRIRHVNPKARIEWTKNGFDPALLQIQAKIVQPSFILFLGRFDIYMKGLDLLIPAYADVAATKDIDLVLAGRATEEAAQKVRTLIPPALRERIRLEVEISEIRKTELLAACLFFCSPSRFEGFGIAALEANAAGKAALVTDTDGFRDSLALGDTALAVAMEDIRALKAAMLRLAEDSELRRQLGSAGRERARAFGWDAIAASEWAFMHKS